MSSTAKIPGKMGKQSYFVYTNSFSDMCSLMEMLVMNSVIFSETGSTAWLAAVLSARVCGGILSSMVSGILADRCSRRQIMIYSDLIRGVIILTLCFFSSPFLLLSGAFLMGIFTSFFSVSFNAEIPQIFGEEKVVKIRSLLSRLSAISMVIGFFGAAILAEVLNPRGIFVIDALSFFLSGTALLNIKWSESNKPVSKAVHKHWIKDSLEACRFVRERPLLFMIFIIFLYQTFAASSQNLGIPILSESLSSENFSFYQGLIWGGWGHGCILTTILVPGLKRLHHNFFFGYMVFSMFASMGFILLMWNNAILYIMVLAFFTGMFDGGKGIFFNAVLQKTDNNIRGRIFGIANFLNRLGFAAAAQVLRHVSMPMLVLFFHGGMILAVLIGFIVLWAKKQDVKKTAIENETI
ncbi:Major Facilitator Superfamily protein [Bacillus sp. OV322]|uniref:MFS transporter n=1 Tax=Bacillus sp. OV322 TaxID=1882764 RepID=UPI0008EBD5A7|nr:MFS transporter [Bacillus sp. OV322]SFC70924.1 Major Facilitator Superfamily protein [Bacillus sp. OV322]